MRPLTPRETGLAFVTAAVLLGVLTWSFGTERLRDWRAISGEWQNLDQRRTMAKRTLERGPEVRHELDALRARLPHVPPTRDVTADLLRTVESLAARHGLLLTRRDPERERSVEGLYEASLVCAWEGSLSALVAFLHAVQTHESMLDIQQLTVRPISGQAGRLRGAFTVDIAFTRDDPSSARSPSES